MARKNTSREEHAFKRMERDIKSGDLPNPLLLFGRERYLIQWATEAIVTREADAASRVLDVSRPEVETLTVDGLINLCETLPMGSGRRIVVIDALYSTGGRTSKKIDESEEEILFAYLTDLPDTVRLIFTAASVDKRRKFYKTIQDKGGCYEFSELSDYLLRKFIEKQLWQGGKTAATAVIDHIITISGYYDKESEYTLAHLGSDLSKMIALSEEKEIQMAEVRDTIAGNTEAYVFDLIDALSEGKKETAFLLLHNLLSSGENEHKLLALICSQLETIVMVKEMMEDRKHFEEMKRLMGIHEFRIKKAIRYAERSELSRLKRTLKQAYVIDRRIKFGQMEARLALELLIAGA